MQEASGIRAGDTVRVIRAANDHEMGWVNSWERSMDECVGHEFKVHSVSGDIVLQMPDRDIYGFPFFALMLIHPKPAVIYLNEEYVATVTRDNVTVGCQVFSHEKILELAEAVKEAKTN